MACRECNDTGEIVVTGMSTNPFSGVPVPDPQTEDIVPCRRCSRPRSFAARGSVERVIRGLENDLRSAA